MHYHDKKPNWENFWLFPLWRKTLCFFVVGGFSCFLSQFLVVFGIANLVTIMTGTQFEDSSVIVRKTWTKKICSHRIDVDKYTPGSGGVCLDGFLFGDLSDDYKLLWKTSNKGDDVILVGKKTILGFSIKKILPMKNAISAK